MYQCFNPNLIHVLQDRSVKLAGLQVQQTRRPIGFYARVEQEVRQAVLI